MSTNFRQNKQLWTFGPRFAQKWILGSGFQKSKSGFRISTSNIRCLLISRQNGQLIIFWPKFGEIAELLAIFCFKYCWGCCRELGGRLNKLSGGRWSWVEVDGAGWSWVEVDGAGWRWVHSLAIPVWIWSKDQVTISWNAKFSWYTWRYGHRN